MKLTPHDAEPLPYDGTDNIKPAATALEPAPYDGAGWPGDGSGTDDLADYNANEAMDYSGE